MSDVIDPAELESLLKELSEFLDDLDTDASITLKKLKAQWNDPEAQKVMKKMDLLIENFDFETATEKLEKLTGLLNRS